MKNLLTDISGVRVGHADDQALASGVTAIVFDKPVIAAMDVRGGAPGTREGALLDLANTVERIDAIALSGGSAFGLETGGGVQAWLAEQGRGFVVRGAVIPIVPGAICFDLLNGGNKKWGRFAPYRDLGYAAAAVAATDFALGNAGAGLGAKAGRLKGGIGSASLRLGDGAMVGAIVAVNCCGAVVRPDSGRFWAAELALAGEIPAQPGIPDLPLDLEDFSACSALLAGANTTIAVVATNAPLSKSGCQRFAIMAQDGLSRAIRPAHTPFDGDTVFALSTGSGEAADPARLTRLGSAAADCLARAIMRAIVAAEPLGGYPNWQQIWGGGT
jgi:L-aminopeptidase/D-esterase-like protein